ncbi:MULTISPECIES: hypothetical protein [Arthrobacter]|uniref:Thiosulfate dehydrogenase [quinone] large subunit n=2 Tax=Arthrobacter TaxID=1663 RepID=A0ABU9KJL1_9MICC|nr:hypothetical protein [Arthrobacter sp. YJM1]MDP5227006.1 hypothetical protein [Arthrobacter sp. YJM1]
MTTETLAPLHHTARPASGSDRLPAAALAVLRILLGAVFAWAFLDKLFGLGFSTPAARSVLAGSSPTKGYLGHLEGWLAGPLGSLAGQWWVDVLFMGGLLGLGVTLLGGFALRAAAVGGSLLLALMWLSALPLQNNPVLDEHVVYAAALFGLAATDAGRRWGLARPWRVFLAARAPKLLPALG